MESRDEIFDDANGDLATGELESAVEKYRRCVEIDPEFFDGWHALGMALMKIGRFPEAIEAGKRATELQPNDQIAWTDRKSTRLNSSHRCISYAVFCLKKKKNKK